MLLDHLISSSSIFGAQQIEEKAITPFFPSNNGKQKPNWRDDTVKEEGIPFQTNDLVPDIPVILYRVDCVYNRFHFLHGQSTAIFSPFSSSTSITFLIPF